MDGYEFEYQCAKILKRKHFSKIKVTQSSGDQGIDIIAFKHRKKYGIQCKYYTHPVGNKAVQEAYAGANFYDCDKAVVMTNITFTKSATQLAQKLDVELWPNCPVTPFYSLPFKIMSSLNAVLFLYAVLAFLSLKPEFDFIHLPFVPDTLTLVIILTASISGIFGWSFFLCNLIAAGSIPLSCISYTHSADICRNRQLHKYTSAFPDSGRCISASCRMDKNQEIKVL